MFNFRKLPKKLPVRTRPKGRYSSTDNHYLEHKEPARKIITEKIHEINKTYKLPIKKIAIRNQKTRWGSCSKLGNLNFNYRIVLLPAHLRDYVIVHEICHLVEFNHSKNFWELVAKTIPNYKEVRRELKKIRF